MSLTKNSKNKEIIEAVKPLCEQWKPFIFARSEPKKGKDGQHYFQVYVALAVPSQNDNQTELEKEVLGWVSFQLKRGIMNVCVEAVRKQPQLKKAFESMLEPLDFKMIVTQTTQKPYETANPKIKPATNDDEEYVLCTINDEPIYETTSFDYGSGFELRRFDDIVWQPRSIFSNEFVKLD